MRIVADSMHGANLNDIVEWDVINWSRALEYWTANTKLQFSNMKALEVGSGNGGLSLWMALRGATVLCTDMKGPSPAALAKHSHKNVSHLINYAALDATNIPYRDEFDVVLFKSVLGGIGMDKATERQEAAVLEIHRSLKTGGELWFAENLSASPIHRALRARFVKWGNRWDYLSTAKMVRLLSGFSEVNYKTIGFLGAFGRSAFQQGILGRLDRWFVDKCVPRSWRYIMIGMARK